MSSSTQINYVIRPNKNVERKLIFKLLECIGLAFELNQYQYIGFGGLVFSDFIMAHKLLGIKSLYSMEMEGLARRAEFNRPYKCINVIGKKSSEALTELSIEKKKSIIWLDYDTGIQGPAMEDCNYIAERAQSGTCLFVTLNANPQSLDSTDNKDDEILEKLYGIVESKLIPSELKPKDLSSKNYPSSLAKITFTRIKSSTITSARNITFKPLFLFSYKDNAQMITVGGIFLNNEDAKVFDEKQIGGELDYITGEQMFPINIPPLTAKEKIHIDSLLPDEKLSLSKISKSLKFEMPQNHIDAYKLFYQHYPVFGEVAI